MIMEILRRSMFGIAYGGIITFLFLTVMTFLNIESTVSEIWKHMLASMLLGIYFAIGSFIWTEIEGWSPLKRTAIHFALSIFVYYIIAFPAGWVPVKISAFLISIFVFSFIYALFWTGYWIYYKKIETSLNENLQKRK